MAKDQSIRWWILVCGTLQVRGKGARELLHLAGHHTQRHGGRQLDDLLRRFPLPCWLSAQSTIAGSHSDVSPALRGYGSGFLRVVPADLRRSSHTGWVRRLR